MHLGKIYRSVFLPQEIYSFLSSKFIKILNPFKCTPEKNAYWFELGRLHMATLGDVVEIVIFSMRDAFLAVTVFVAAMVLLFSWLQYATSGRFVEYIRRREKLQPVIGALMGLTPGCGGAIVMMPMYARGLSLIHI